MSTGDTERIVREIYDRWNATAEGALEAGANPASDLFHPDVEIRQTGALIDTAREFHGLEGLVAAGKELGEAFSQILWLAEEWTELNGWLIVRLNFRATGRGSGLEPDIRVIHAWRATDGKISAFHIYASMTEAREALAASD